MNFKPLDKRSPVPLYYQLVEWLREQIASGLLPAGQQLPSERELGEQVGISRMTVRQALTYLANEGLLVVKPGIGTFVAEPKLTHDALNLLGFTEEMMRQGGIVISEVLEQRVMAAPSRVAERLKLAPYEPVMKIVRLRYVDQIPLLLETSFLPASLCSGLESEDLEARSLYTLLETQYGLHLQRASQTFEVTVVNDYEMPLFDVAPHTPMILLEGVSFTGHERPAEYFKAIYRGDRFRFTVESRRSEHPNHLTNPPLLGIVITPEGG
jgi:GntR family transcriptional regulator